MKIKVFSLARYVEEALKKAEYARDEDGVVIAKVPTVSGFFAQGDSFEEARENLREVIEGNVLLALQLGLEIPRIEGVEILERRVARHSKKAWPDSHRLNRQK
ncbi:MAG: type II toxin-antitoxin system HicB family antitoxin [Acidobacteriota bacterium]|nr:type II toxin-antitoxin system HicB family antitoxin [Blastocatellia bacterium]MDW8240764.1 type II toxin-antitoxin system HicB family antitoxin [Acidobacteriota bacterium]